MTISETVGAVSDCDAPFYDLSGRRVKGQPTTPGIYIQRGKKLIISN